MGSSYRPTTLNPIFSIFIQCSLNNIEIGDSNLTFFCSKICHISSPLIERVNPMVHCYNPGVQIQPWDHCHRQWRTAQLPHRGVTAQEVASNIWISGDPCKATLQKTPTKEGQIPQLWVGPPLLCLQSHSHRILICTILLWFISSSARSKPFVHIWL